MAALTLEEGGALRPFVQLFQAAAWFQESLLQSFWKEVHCVLNGSLANPRPSSDDLLSDQVFHWHHGLSHVIELGRQQGFGGLLKNRALHFAFLQVLQHQTDVIHRARLCRGEFLSWETFRHFTSWTEGKIVEAVDDAHHPIRNLLALIQQVGRHLLGVNGQQIVTPHLETRGKLLERHSATTRESGQVT